MKIIDIETLYNLFTDQGIAMNVDGSLITISYKGVESTINGAHKGILRILFEIMNSDTMQKFMEIK